MSYSTVPEPLAELIDRLDARLLGVEALELEFKLASGGLPRNVWDTVSAFANTSGGWIILGVNDQVEPMAIVGVPRAADILHDFVTQLRNRNKISMEPCGPNDTGIELVDGNELVVIRVNPASYSARPVFINGNAYGGTFVRRHSSDQRCTETEIDQMKRDAGTPAADAAVLRNYGWQDIDPVTFSRYRQRFNVANPGAVEAGMADQEFLEAMNGHRRDRHTGDEGLTVAGLLMFGKDRSIREWRSRQMFDFRLLAGDLENGADWDDRFLWEGNLLGAFEQLLPRLTDRLPVPFRLDGPVRVSETPVHRALREALVNLLVHADYRETRSSLIFRTADRILFQNPGNSRSLAVGQRAGRDAEPRNPDLVLMFRRINLAEEAGTGVWTILQTWRELGYQAPTIDAGMARYEFTLELKFLHLLSVDDRQWLHELDPELAEPEQAALLLARDEAGVDNVTLRSLTRQHPADTTKTLGALRDRGLLEMIGSGRTARYVLGPKSRPEPVAVDIELLGSDLEPKSSGVEPISSAANHGSSEVQSGSSGAEASMVSVGTSSLTPGGSSLEPEASSRMPGGSLVDADDQWEALMLLSHDARTRRRLPRSTLQETILTLCTATPLSVQDLARLMERRPAYIGYRLVAPLVSTGRLARLYPDQPNHPGQKYVTPSTVQGTSDTNEGDDR
ncbi:MAG: putative DNA binding domain-containing protein [Chloroflexota bacterium]|nr:putative DNA binding domain-containing protein [Chloroflexota bacterium]